jgi:hypothetical protein
MKVPNSKGQRPTNRTASQSGAGALVAAVTGDTVIITDILASAATTISTLAAGSGTVLAYMPAGVSNFSSGLPVATSAGVFNSAGNVTINYYVK